MLKEFFDFLESFGRKNAKLGYYTFLNVASDLNNAKYAEMDGLINSFDSQPVDNKRLIFIDKEYCEEILHSYSDDYVNKMDCLTDLYLEDLLLNKEKIKNM